MQTRSERRKARAAARFDIATGDVISVLATVPDNSFDAVLCDPPYGYRFMGKRWDYQVPNVALWREVLRVCKPGAALVSFGGTRTFHRVAVNIEDAGFELRDVLSWMYGSGFPKSHDVSKAIDKAAGAAREVIGTKPNPDGYTRTASRTATGFFTGKEVALARVAMGAHDVAAATIITAPATPLAEQWSGYGTSLKPAWEPAILGRKPLEGTVAANVAKWGCGALAIDACRIGTDGATKRSGQAPYAASGWRTGHEIVALDGLGRWPANVAMDEDAAAALDAQTGNLGKSSGGGLSNGDKFGGGYAPPGAATIGFGDSGGASRFFYCAKVSTREREHGCASLPQRSAGECTQHADVAEGDEERRAAGLNSSRAGANRGSGARNHHPTLKPIALTRWLARLIMPPTSGAKLLVPFAGAGSEMIGALLAGWSHVLGIEREAEYVEIARARCTAALNTKAL